ncbi:Lysyl-lysine 2,3-aminomutase [hydrothermal vent metagenome]|uniref:Lysyl-lysine 2,3-aminomutase n=1 Tax=hydrothermal vent metagenome TaxID=652676 RepID=A0A1W1BYT1_9ZZZZ
MNIWQDEARKCFKTAKEFNEYLNNKTCVDLEFPLKIPKKFAQHIKGKPQVLKQFISTKKEQDDFNISPLNDEKNMPVEGLIHKYKNRVLLITSQHCFVHCRYCFRQNFPYQTNDVLKYWQEISDYLSNNKNINEVILSGGDPMSLSDEKLIKLITNISTINHIKTLRIHTRNLVIIPTRITNIFANFLKENRLNIVIVFHINHFLELSDEFIKQLNKLKDNNITLLNQSVLLKGVNDNAEILTKLSNDLFMIGILPYYLHLLDRVKGSKQFLVEENEIIKIYQAMQENLSGYLLPKLVQDKGGLAKEIFNSF